MAFTASDIRNFASGGTQVSTGSYREGSTSPVPVMKKNGAFYWHSGMSIDCDGQPGSFCNKTEDPYFQPNTSWTQSDGRALKAEVLPFVVVPLPSPIWNFKTAGIMGGDLVVMAYRDKYVFGIVGDQGPSQRIGEASYAAAKALGINPNPRSGGVGSGVTYVVFPGSRVPPIEDIAKINSRTPQFVQTWLGQPTTPPPVDPPNPPVTETQQHLVAAGDTLSAIATKYKMTVDEVAELNHLLREGMVLAVRKLDPYDNGLPVANSQTPSAIPLQKELKRVGYMPASIPEHPNYGPKTQEAVAQFHYANTEFKDPNSTRDVTINRAGWDHLRKMDDDTAGPLVVNVVKTVVERPSSPVPGYDVTYPYGEVSTRYAAGYHTGDDYAAPEGKPVVAVRDGEIVWANDNGGAYGKWLGLRADNDRDYVYCHLSSIHVGATTGARVKAGQIIGYVGSTGNSSGPHLHFEDRPAGGAYGTGRKPIW